MAKKKTGAKVKATSYRCRVVCAVLNRREERTLSLGPGVLIDGDIYLELLERGDITADMFEDASAVPLENTPAETPVEADEIKET